MNYKKTYIAEFINDGDKKNRYFEVNCEEIAECYVNGEFCGVEFDNGKILIRKKHIEYPKTYEECCETMKVINSVNPCMVANCLGHTISNLAKLIVARDAYWSIYSDNMGLSKSWQPDWTNTNENKYCIYFVANELKRQPTLELQHLLAFPTRAICDAFFKDFRTLIESCKEFL